MHCSKTLVLQGDRSSTFAGMRLGFDKNSRNFYVFSNNYIFIQYQHNQQSHISYDVIHSIMSKAGTCMTLVVPVTTLLTYMIITMVRIRLWLFGITSEMLGLRMLQLLCRLTNKITFVMVMKFTPSLEETTVQAINMKCFFISSSVMCFSHFTF